MFMSHSMHTNTLIFALEQVRSGFVIRNTSIAGLQLD